jgi:mitogen-activated protein kinase kinase kinase
MESDTGDLMIARQIAIADISALSALSSEVELMATLEHDNVVRYTGGRLLCALCIVFKDVELSTGSEIHDNTYIIFLQYIAGGGLNSLIRNYGAFEEKLCRGMLRHLLHGLKYLHDRNIVHGSINGRKVLIDSSGYAKISPFRATFQQAEAGEYTD